MTTAAGEGRQGVGRTTAMSCGAWSAVGALGDDEQDEGTVRRRMQRHRVMNQTVAPKARTPAAITNGTGGSSQGEYGRPAAAEDRPEGGPGAVGQGEEDDRRGPPGRPPARRCRPAPGRAAPARRQTDEGAGRIAPPPAARGGVSAIR